jgi:hypothetical protein
MPKADRIGRLGATAFNVPSPESLPDLIARISRLWAELHEADPDLALELARKLPEATSMRARQRCRA